MVSYTRLQRLSRLIATMLRYRPPTNYTIWLTTCLRCRNCACIRLTLRVYFFDDSLAQASFRIERVDHKLNFAGECVRKLELSECDGFARIDVHLKVGGVGEPCRDTAFARCLNTFKHDETFF